MDANIKKFSDPPSFVAQAQPDFPVYCLRPNVLRDSAAEFMRLFPGRVMYAVKCNPNPRVIEALHQGGIRDFETASLPGDCKPVHRPDRVSDASVVRPAGTDPAAARP